MGRLKVRFELLPPSQLPVYSTTLEPTWCWAKNDGWVRLAGMAYLIQVRLDSSLAADQLACSLLKKRTPYWTKFVYEVIPEGGYLLSIVRSATEPVGADLDPPDDWKGTRALIAKHGIKQWPTLWDRLMQDVLTPPS